MTYLCAQAGDTPSATAESDTLESVLEAWGMAVLVRFASPRARRILIAAMGASSTYPAALQIFWERGPGQAVDAIAEALRREKRRTAIAVRSPNVEARRFVLMLCGPLVLDQLFDASAVPGERQLRRHLDETVRSFLEKLEA